METLHSYRVAVCVIVITVDNTVAAIQILPCLLNVLTRPRAVRLFVASHNHQPVEHFPALNDFGGHTY